MDRIKPRIGILIGVLALLSAAVPALAAEPPAGVAFDGVVTVVFHDPAFDGGNGIDGADVTLTVVDLATPGVVLQEEHGSTDASGTATFTAIARPTDPGVELELQATAVRDRTSVDPDGCTVDEHLAGSATAAAGLEVTIDVGVIDQQVGQTCSPPSEVPPSDTPPSDTPPTDTPPSEGPTVIVEGTAVDPDGQPLAIVAAQAMLTTGDESHTLPIETAGDGTFHVEVPALTDPGVERLLTIFIIGPETRTELDERGCMFSFAYVARGTWTLVGDEAPEPTTLVGVEEEVSAVCGVVQPPDPPVAPNPTPRPPVAPQVTQGAATPHRTLPPTDTASGISPERGGGVPAALLLLLACSLSVTVAARRFSRRGS